MRRFDYLIQHTHKSFWRKLNVRPHERDQSDPTRPLAKHEHHSIIKMPCVAFIARPAARQSIHPYAQKKKKNTPHRLAPPENKAFTKTMEAKTKQKSENVRQSNKIPTPRERARGRSAPSSLKRSFAGSMPDRMQKKPCRVNLPERRLTVLLTPPQGRLRYLCEDSCVP